MELGLKNKVAVITGASIGIGAEIAAALASEGCKVIICYLEREETVCDDEVEINSVLPLAVNIS